MPKLRYLKSQVLSDLEKKMVFLGGPRQVGKTTLGQSLITKTGYQYLNWDIDSHRATILKKEFAANKQLLIFDELHKYRNWRNYLKGIFDSIQPKESSKLKILVTGSARLDYYRFGGDSLQGRYHYLRLLPLTFSELKCSSNKDIESLMRLSGFPEPYFSQSEKEARRWSKEYISRLSREDIRELESITNLGQVENLALALPDYVGSPLSINNLRENMQVAHETLSKWILALERLYLVFRISPFTGNLLKSVKKEQKLYFYNWTYLNNDDFRFENLIALHLLKYCYWLEDTEGRRTSLHFTKIKNAGEIDFVVCENNNPILFVETKLGDQDLNSQLYYFQKKYPHAKYYQIHLRGKKDYQTPSGIRVCPASVFFKEFELI